jgi:integrase
MSEEIRHRRRGLSDKQVKALPRRAKRYAFSDPAQAGHFVRVMPDGPPHSFVVVCRDRLGKQVWTTLGSSGVLPIEQARERAREVIRRIKAGLPAVEPPPVALVAPDSFQSVAETWLKRHVIPRGLRTRPEIERRLTKYVYPAWAERPFREIRRSDVAALLDHIQDRHGPQQADSCLGDIRSIANWFATRDDLYVAPFARGMRRTDARQRSRTRILTDHEIGEVWRAAEHNGVYGAIVRFALLTAQRRQKIIELRWDSIKDGTWHVHRAEREKGAPEQLILPPLALKLLDELPRLAGNPYVFAGRNNGHFTGMPHGALQFHKKLKGVAPFWLHDLRRTARSLMSRAGVAPHIAERVLGHAIKGVEGVYDRHRYGAEIGAALVALATLIERILAGPADNVVPLHAPAAQ